MKQVEWVRVKYLGECDEKTIVFYAIKYKGDKHIYDSACIVNQPAPEGLETCDLITDLVDIEYTPEGWIKEIRFKEEFCNGR